MPGVARIYRALPDEPRVVVVRIVCEHHLDGAHTTGWRNRPYDGPLPCFICVR